MSVMTPSSTITAPARFLLLGDSHVGPVGRAAQAAHIPFQGGPIGAGRDFFDDFFAAGEHDIVFQVPETEQYFRGFLNELSISCLDELAIPLVTTIGFSVHFVATQHNWIYYRCADGYPTDFLSSPLFQDIVAAMAAPALRFYRQMRAFNLRVVAVLPAQRVPRQSDPVIFHAAQDVVRQHVAKIGIEIVDLRDRIIDATGFQRPELCEEDDEIHGNLAWGRIVLSELLDLGL
jgi:hypothetical protein